jgi:flagellar motor switch protein FliG
MDSTQPMLSKILSEDWVGDIIEEIRGPAGRKMWGKLDNVNEQVLGNFLKNEYPQTIAVILGKIDQTHSGMVVATLPENFAMEVGHAHAAHRGGQREYKEECGASAAHRVLV